MPKIIRAEFLKYYNSTQNSDKVFNIFLIEEDNATFSCISEYGRRGNKLVRRTLCENETRVFAEGELRQKLLAKRNHRSTPYTSDQFGFNYSSLVKEYEFDESDDGSVSGSEPVGKPTETQETLVDSPNNVIEFPVSQPNKRPYKPNQAGILNKGQFDSLEF